MKLVLSWLTDYLELNPGTTPEALAAGLVQLGHEVDGIHTTAPAFTHVVVGKVRERVPHPNAERLGVCQVEIAPGEVKQIVCGAPNARAGLTVAVALPGAVLPGDFKIKSSKIRDVLSDGMICSVKELGLGDEHNGIWELTTDAAVGTPLPAILPPPEVVLEVAVTPNRGDCLSHLGLARDLAALGLGTLKPLPALTVQNDDGTFAVQAKIEGGACLQLNLIPLAGLTANAPSPALIQQRLVAAGQRPKNALVDVTTYVMLALGQPLHAYDADRLAGTTLTATQAQAGQAFAGLTGSHHTLAAADVIVTDASGAALGLAGILGGASSAITDTTTRVVLEAAVWDPVQIALSGQRHQLHTDAKARFERGIDPALAPYALQYAAQLLQQWAGGTVGKLATAGAGVPAPEPIRYHPAFFTKYIGVSVPNDRQQQILTTLGFGIREIQAGWLVMPPTWRTYMATPEDLTEEVLRVVGYETVPHQLPTSSPAQFGVAGEAVTLDRRARKALAGAGFTELLTYSFIGQDAANAYANGHTPLLQLANPLAQTDMTTLRPSLLPGVLTALAKNFANSDLGPAPVLQLAEVGKAFRPVGDKTGETLMAAGVLAHTGGRHWQQAVAVPEAFAAKGAALRVLEALGAPVASGTTVAEAPAHYHPGRSGTFSIGPFVLAHFGELHPTQRAALEIPASAGPLAVFELYLEPLLKLSAKPRSWQPSPFPPVKRDVSLLVAETVPAAAVLATLTKASKNLPHGTQLQAEVFDRYSGAQVPGGQVALGLALTLQSPEKTLTEAEVQAILAPLLAAVQSAHAATLRG
ncbi:MAG: phenylalanine--tRNA ligase subunit beta [Alphaproteobacteria bacterium]|nr:phenylalanine--tRNA ligase subunit beta [Alphaproteobacteria bacterium]